MKTNLRNNSKAIIILVIIAAFLFVAARGMSGRDVLITVLRGFSTGSVHFFGSSRLLVDFWSAGCA